MEKSLSQYGFINSGENTYQLFSDIFSVTVIVEPTQVFISSHIEISQDEIDAKVGELKDKDDFAPLILEWINERIISEDAPGFRRRCSKCTLL